MATTLNPYLNFRGQAREAMEFYRSVFGGKLDVMTFAQGGMSSGPELDEQVMHAALTTDAGHTLMGADVPPGMELTPGTNVSVSLSGQDTELLRGWFLGLAEGGVVTAPFELAPWGDVFGMLTDRFGISWLVDAAAPDPEPS